MKVKTICDNCTKWDEQKQECSLDYIEIVNGHCIEKIQKKK